MILSDLKVLE